MKPKIAISDIRDEINQIRHTNPRLKDDGAFVCWFLRAFLVDSDEAAVKALTGDTGDKGIDAIFPDDKARQVNVIQGKFRHSLGESSEKRNDVLSFAELANFPWEDKDFQNDYYSKLDPLVKDKMEQLVELVRRRKYELQFYYVTTGRISETIRREAAARVRNAQGAVTITILDSVRVATIFKDYQEGVAPAVPSLSLKIAAEGAIVTEGVIHRFDSEKSIESWVFSMTSIDVGEMFKRSGIRLFARNVRVTWRRSGWRNRPLSIAGFEIYT